MHLHLLPEQRYHRLVFVVGHVRIVETVEFVQLRFCSYAYVAQVLLPQETIHHSLIAFKKMTY